MKYATEATKLEYPPAEFCEWWNPSGRDHQSGADIGGHPDAERVWARKEPGRWRHRTYGTNARVAWNAQCYRNEFLQWVAVGRPEQAECEMFASPITEQLRFLREMKSILAKIGKPLPKPEPFDFDPPISGAKLEY